MSRAGRPGPTRRVVIAGLSARALAESAARAGYAVHAIDGFGDLDLRAAAERWTVCRRGSAGFRAMEAARAASVASAGAGRVPRAYAATFENAPEAVRLLAHGGELLGNPPEVLARVRDPLQVARALAAAGFAPPRTRATAPAAGSAEAERRWLLKRRRSGGGHGIVPWEPGVAVPRSRYLQERVAGVPGSVVFVADGARALVLGISRQLVARAAFGASGFQYCGSILSSARRPALPEHARVAEAARALAEAAVRAFGLRGVNGIDFVARRGRVHPIEINPRYTASMELVERAAGVSIFQLHLLGCRGSLPPALEIGAAARSFGKAILYARRDGTAGDTGAWLEDDTVRDIPAPDTEIRRGHPICTVLAEGASARACEARLRRKAARLYRAWTGGRKAARRAA